MQRTNSKYNRNRWRCRQLHGKLKLNPVEGRNLHRGGASRILHLKVMLHNMGMTEKPEPQHSTQGGRAPAGSHAPAPSAGKRKRSVAQQPALCQDTVSIGGQALALVQTGQALLTAAASSAQQSQAEALPFRTNPMQHMEVYRKWLESLPGSWQLGDYARGHLCRKHCFVQASAGGPSATEGLASMPLLTLDEISSISPDRSAFLSQVPPHLKKPGRLAALMGCHQLMVPMWACLVKDALAQHAIMDDTADGQSLLDSVQREGPAWKAAAENYRREFGVAPCLAELVKAYFEG